LTNPRAVTTILTPIPFLSPLGKGKRMSRPSARRGPARWGIAFIVTVVVLLVSHGLKPFVGDIAPYLTAIPAVAFSVWYCGIGPSFLSIAVVLLTATYWHTEPTHSLHAIDVTYWVESTVFLIASGLVVVVGELAHRENERLLSAHGELEERVRERTVDLDIANQGLSELTARLLRLQDDERRRIARDLHDSIGQILAALGMNLSTVLADIDRLAKTANLVKDSRELVAETSTNIRTISYLLHPPLLDENGLASALPWYIDGFSERSNIKVDLDLPEDLGRLPQDSEVAIFRIVQECLTNIHRHSESATAKIRVTRSESQVVVSVEDCGKGISAEKVAEMASRGVPGVGLRGMRERVRQLGGSLEIESAGSGKGTVVKALLPVADGAASRRMVAGLQP